VVRFPGQRALGELRLIGVLVLVRSRQPPRLRAAEVLGRGIISLTDTACWAAITVLTVMIAPLMVSIFSDGLRSVKRAGSRARWSLGVNRWRTTWKIGVRTARPAIVAGTVLSVARAIGDAVMLR